MTTEEMKKYGMFCVIGIVLVAGIVGIFVPETRQFMGEIVKGMLTAMPSFIK